MSLCDSVLRISKASSDRVFRKVADSDTNKAILSSIDVVTINMY